MRLHSSSPSSSSSSSPPCCDLFITLFLLMTNSEKVPKCESFCGLDFYDWNAVDISLLGGKYGRLCYEKRREYYLRSTVVVSPPFGPRNWPFWAEIGKAERPFFTRRHPPCLKAWNSTANQDRDRA